MTQDEYNRLQSFCQNAQQSRILTAVLQHSTYRTAAESLGVSKVTVKSAMQRMKGRARSGAVEAEPPTTDEILSSYADRRSGAAARRDVQTLAGELELFRKERRLLAELTNAPLLPVTRSERRSGLREAVVKVNWSDWHVEELMRPSRVTQGNAFTLAIADARITRLAEGVVWFVGMAQSIFKIRRLVLWLGGDFTTGTLHEENTETAQLLPMAAQLWVYQRLVRSIQTLLDRLPDFELLIPCSYGNHGRTTRTMHYSTGASHNLDWLMYQFLALHFQHEPRVQFMADESEHQYVDLYDRTTHYHHGHRIRYGGGVGGIMIPVNKAVAQWDKIEACDYHDFGHYHQLIHNGGICVNGSLPGFGPLAAGFKCAPEPPQQAVYIQDAKRGKSICAPIWVAKGETEAKLWERFEASERDNHEKGNL